MKLVALEIPDDLALLPGWLEGHLVNTDLAALVAELEAVHDEHPDNLSLTDVLRDRRDAVLSRGLASLPAEGLKSLLRNPRLLLELQELILTEGGPCWLNGAAEAASKQEDLERVWNRLSDPLQQTSRAITQPVAPPSRRVVPLARWIATFAAAAAIVLGVGVFLVERRRGSDQGATAVAALRLGLEPPRRTGRRLVSGRLPRSTCRCRRRVVQETARRPDRPGPANRRVPPGLFRAHPLAAQAAFGPGPRLAGREMPRLGRQARCPPGSAQGRSQRGEGTRRCRRHDQQADQSASRSSEVTGLTFQNPVTRCDHLAFPEPPCSDIVRVRPPFPDPKPAGNRWPPRPEERNDNTPGLPSSINWRISTCGVFPQRRRKPC